MSTMQQSSIASATGGISPTALERVSHNSSKIEQAKLALRLNPTGSIQKENSSQNKSFKAEKEENDDPLVKMAELDNDQKIVFLTN